MPRLKPEEGIEMFYAADPIDSWQEYTMEDVRDLATGLIGAQLRLRLPSLSGPELGVGIPLLVTNVPGDILRIFIAPVIEAYNEDGQEFVRLTARAYTEERMALDTAELWYTPFQSLQDELLYQKKILQL